MIEDLPEGQTQYDEKDSNVWLEQAQIEADRQNGLIYETALNQAQFENLIRSVVQQATAMNSYFVLSMFYSALRDA